VEIMSDVNKIADLCYTASFAFDRLSDLAMQIHDLERESIKTPITVEHVEQNVLKFNSELDDVPRMRPSSRAYVPRRSTFNRAALDGYNNPYTPYQLPNSYRLVNSATAGKSYALQNNPMNAATNSSAMRRKRPRGDSLETVNEPKQVKGIKWVAATGEHVQQNRQSPTVSAHDANTQ